MNIIEKMSKRIVGVKCGLQIQLFAKPKFNEKVLRFFTIYCIIKVYYTTIENTCISAFRILCR